MGPRSELDRGAVAQIRRGSRRKGAGSSAAPGLADRAGGVPPGFGPSGTGSWTQAVGVGQANIHCTPKRSLSVPKVSPQNAA